MSLIVQVMCVRRAAKFVRTLKIPISICRKRVGLTAGGMNTLKHCTQESGTGGGGGGGGGRGKQQKTAGYSAVLGKLAFPRESRPNFSRIALGQDSNLI